VTFPAAPTIFVVDTLRTTIWTDLQGRGIAAEILIGEWEDEKHRGQPRVVIGLDAFEIGEPGGHYQPGAAWPVGSTQVARALGEDVESYSIWVHGIAPAGTPPDQVARASRIATKELVHATWAAIRRAHGGMFRARGRGQWINEVRGEFVYGALARFTLTIADPVLDDPLDLGAGTVLQMSASMTLGDTQTPAEVVSVS
jgi:hypothetical protein